MVMTTEAGKYAGVDFTYDQVGRLNSISRTANGDPSTTISTSYTLDLLDRVTTITHRKVAGEVATTLSAFTYGYDANGRVASYTGPEGSLSFAVDANGQLLSVTGARSEAFAFDPNGNRSSSTTGTGNLLLSDSQFSYTYDLEGNRKTRTRLSDGQLTEYFWDHRNQLTKARIKDASGTLLKELRFTYDVVNRRVGVWVDGDGAGPADPDQVWTVYDGANPYMDFDGEGQLQARYLYGPGIDELFARIGTGEDPQWFLTDRLGSVRLIVDAAGAVLDEISYDSFGGILSESNPAAGDRFKFTSREYCPELGLYYYRARWYDPAVGRFISQDPIGFSAGDPNLYRYVGNAPGDGTDPWGLQKSLVEQLQEGNNYRNQLLEDLSKGDQASLDRFMRGDPFKTEFQENWWQVFHFPQDSNNNGQGEPWYWAYIHGALDVAGTVEPTPICDSFNAILYLFRGNWADAGTTFLGVIPYFGDWAKAGKYGKKIINSPATKPSIWSSTPFKTSFENAFMHWKKHRADFPQFQNAKQYVEGVHHFLKNPPTGTLVKTRPNGEKLLYDPVSNTFAIQGKDGAPKTMFKPTDGINYWNKQ